MKAALIQTSPVFLNLDQSLEKAKNLMGQAAQNGADLVVFPETWLPGYPVWLDNSREAAMWNHPGAKALYRILFDNSLKLGSKNFHELWNAGKKYGVDFVMGCHEVDGLTIYNSMIFFPSKKEGKASIHRKLMPTYNEKLIWGQGNGKFLGTMETDAGTLGGLICWEHWMPLARAALHAKKEVIHVAQWPSVIDLHQLASRHYAFEGRCFVLACGSVLHHDQVMKGFDSLNLNETYARQMLKDLIPGDGGFVMTGGGAVIGPDAGYVMEPVYKKEGILYANLDFDLIKEAAMVLDTDGHYARPDIFSLHVNARPAQHVEFIRKEHH